MKATLLAGRKVWFVADLGASYALNQVRIWNFQWDHSTGDLSDRGISQFDLYVRDSVADTDRRHIRRHRDQPQLSGRPSTSAVSNPWQAVLVNQPLGEGTQHRQLHRRDFSLTGQTGRFLALLPTATMAATASPSARYGCGRGKGR